MSDPVYSSPEQFTREKQKGLARMFGGGSGGGGDKVGVGKMVLATS